MVGLQFYKKAEKCVGVRIQQAPLINGRVDPSKVTWKENSSLSPNSIPVGTRDIFRRRTWDIRPIDIEFGNTSPDWIGTAANGVELWNSSSRISLKVHGTEVSSEGELLPGWQDTWSKEFEKGTDGVDFVFIQGSAKYVSLNPVTTSPLAPINGLQLHQVSDGDTYRVGFSVKSDYPKMQKLADFYAVRTLARKHLS
jgi:hypothetical protein